MVSAPGAGIGVEGVGTALLQRGVPGEGELARGVHVAEEHGGDGLAGLGADEPGLYDGRHLVDPGQGSAVAGDVDEHQARVHLQDGLDGLVLGVGQIVRQAVVALAVLMVALVQSANEDDDISLTGFLHGLADQLVLGACLVERAPYGDAVVALHGVAHVATGVVKCWALSIEV